MNRCHTLISRKNDGFDMVLIISCFSDMPGVSATNESDNSGDSKDAKSSSSVSVTKGNVKVREYDPRKDLRALGQWICSNQDPPKYFENVDYIQSIGVFNQLFKPTFNEVESECMEEYERMKVETKKVLRNFDGQISLSVDVLTDNNDFGQCSNNLGQHYSDYLCISAHFIDKKWKLRKWVLYFCTLSVSGQSDDLLKKCEDRGIFRSLEDWGIENKIFTLTMGNDKFCNEVAGYVKRYIQVQKELRRNSQLFRVYCCGDLFREMVQDAFDKIEDIVHKVRRVYTFTTDYPMWFLKMANLQEALKLWSIGKLSSKDVIDSHDVPSPEEWNKVEGVCKAVESIHEVSGALFEPEIQVTANVYLYHLHELREMLTRMSIGSEGFNRSIVEGMLGKVDEYWDHMFLLLAISAALDPRFKMRYIEFVCSKVEGRDENSQVPAVLDAIRKQFDEYVIRFPEKRNCASYSHSEGQSDPPVRANHTFTVLQDYQQFIQSNHHPAKISELDIYLDQPVLPWSQDFNPLAWWRSAAAKYPTLSRMARDFLAIPVSLSTCGEAYYTLSRPADEHMICLKPDLMNALMCARSWAYRR